MYESEEDYYEPVRTSNAFNKNYIEYESNGDNDKSLSVKEYLDMIKQEGEWKIQLTFQFF